MSARGKPLPSCFKKRKCDAVFQGPDGYVSPNWYPSKAATGKVVPTWNYIAVQARGALRVRDDASWVKRHVAALTTRHESSQRVPWTIDDAPADYVEKLVGAVVGPRSSCARSSASGSSVKIARPKIEQA